MRLTASAGGAALAVVAALAIVVSPPSQAATDEDQVRAVLTGMNAAYNGSDFSEFAAHLCPTMLQTAGFAANWYASRSSDGPTRITVNSVKVHGDPPDLAIANVRFEAAKRGDAKTLDIDLVRDGAAWKACRYNAGRTV
jgi:hypothetical protein